MCLNVVGPQNILDLLLCVYLHRLLYYLQNNDVTNIRLHMGSFILLTSLSRHYETTNIMACVNTTDKTGQVVCLAP